MEQLTPNMGGKRKPEDENDEESPENTNQLAKRRRKGFQMDIRMFSTPTNTFDNRVNQTFNNKINEIYCRHLPSQTRTAVEPENDASGYRVTMMGNAVKCHSVSTTTNMGVGTAGTGFGNRLPVCIPNISHTTCEYCQRCNWQQ
jgi:hypothetical protein